MIENNALNLYHKNIKLTLELDPTKFPDTEIIRKNNKTTTQVHNKMKKLHVHSLPDLLVLIYINLVMVMKVLRKCLLAS